MVLYLNNDSLVFIDNHSWLSKGKLSVELWKPSQELYLPKPWNTSSDNDDVWYVVVLEVLNILLESYYNTEGALCANEGSVERNQKGGRPASSFNHIRIIQCWVNQWNLKLTWVLQRGCMSWERIAVMTRPQCDYQPQADHKAMHCAKWPKRVSSD